MSSSHRLTLSITDLNSQGEGVARLGRDVYFVPKALPGEQVEVVLDGRRRKVWQTKLLAIHSSSEHRTEPLCPHYQRCGGCNLQHLEYPQQLMFKQERVQREFSRQQLTFPEFSPSLQAQPWHYRRKARVGVRYSAKTGQNIVGFREAGSSHLSAIGECAVLPQHPALNWANWQQQINALQGRALITQIEVTVADNALALVLRALKPLIPADIQALKAFVAPWQTGEVLPVQLWLKTDKEQAAQPLMPEQPAPLQQTVAGLEIKVQLDDFMQVNGAINQQMVAQAMEWLQLQGHEQLWDMFAGHGNFSLPLAQRVQQVHAFEGSERMVASLQQQATEKDLPVQAQTMDLTQPHFAQLSSPDVVVLDPPRAGAWELMPVLVQHRVPKVLYVSCDVATLARDLAVLQQAGYVLTRAGIMDMFPQTHHIETMVLLELPTKGRADHG